jgi:hypothetical protein
MGLYQMDHVTEKPVLARLRSVYRPFRESSETAVLGVEEPVVGLPPRFWLEQNFPNPFNPATTIEYAVSGSGGQASGVSKVRLAVYDLLGREVAVLVEEEKGPGFYQVTFNAAGRASGAYYYRLTAGSYAQTRAMLLVR